MISFLQSQKAYLVLLFLLSIGIGLQIALYKLATIFLFLQWLISKDFKKKFIKLKQNIFAIGMIVFYFLYFLSWFWSDNGAKAISDLILKLPILILPLVILSQKIPSSRQLNQLFVSFAFASLAINLYSFFEAYLLYIETNNINRLYYSNLTVNMHTSAQAMFTCFSIVIFVYTLSKERIFNKKLALYFSIAIQMIFIFLLSSRMQILIMAVLIPAYLITFYYNKQKTIIGVLYTILIFGFSYFLIITTPSTLNARYSKTVSQINSLQIDNGNYDARIFIWKEALEVIKNNWLLGTGAGDNKDILVDRYLQFLLDNQVTKSSIDTTINDFQNKTATNDLLGTHAKKLLEKRNRHYKNAYQRKYNFHNQYLQTFGTIGIFGFLVLFLLMVYPLFLSIKDKNYLAVSFLFILGASCLTESIFERQAGVAFYALFYVLIVGRISMNRPS